MADQNVAELYINSTFSKYLVTFYAHSKLKISHFYLKKPIIVQYIND